MVEEGQRKEVAVRFDTHFGKRPDVLSYEQDVLELAKQGATSFHASEELWSNPLQLQTGMRRQDLDELRMGWDLILDVDCPSLALSKHIAASLVAALRREGVKSISAKYSGNKGFHIGVPWQAFPDYMGEKDVAKEFPEYPKRIIEYLIRIVELHVVSVEGTAISFAGTKIERSKVAEMVGVSEKELLQQECMVHHIRLEGKSEEKKVYVCKSCTKQFGNPVEECINCGGKFIKEEIHEVKEAAHCGCPAINFKPILNVKKILSLDALLFSSRHMYRMAYSLHEKSSRISLPIDPDRIPEFDEKTAEGSQFAGPKHGWLDRQAQGDAEDLLQHALDYSFVAPEVEEEKPQEYEIPDEAIEEKYFPECIKKILAGMDDGKKRGLFILTNFLGSVGWEPDAIEARVEEWNKVNKEPLREVYIKSQLSYHKRQGKGKAPPNCANDAYYKDLGVKCAEDICSRCKNPVIAAKRTAQKS